MVRVPPKLMAHVRDCARSYGKSDPIDALAVARAALREPDLPGRPVSTVSNAKSGSSSIIAGDLVGERARIIARLRWHLHELDPGWTPPTKMDRASDFVKVQAHVSDFAGLVADLAARLVDHLRGLTVEIDELAAEITSRITVLAPSLLAISGCAALTAAKILGEGSAGRPIPLQGCVRPPQRDRAVTGVVVESCSTSSLAQREPANQCRNSPDRSDSSTVPRTRPRVARPPPKER